MEAARAQGAEKERPARQQGGRNVRSGYRRQGRERKLEAGQGESIARFKQAQKEFIQVPAWRTLIPRPRRAPASCAKR